MTFREFLDLSLIEAAFGLPPEVAMLITSDGATETVIREVFQDVGTTCAKIPRLRHLMRRSLDIELTDGYGTIPDQALTAYMDESSVFNENSPDDEYSYTEWYDFTKDTEVRIGHYAIKGERTLGLRAVGELFSASLTTDDTVELTIPCAPQVPATESTELDVNDEVLSNLQQALAMKLRSQVVKA